MNKLDTLNLGGVSLEWDDFKFEQDAIRNAFQGMISAYGLTDSDSYILSGCQSVLNGLNFDISAGYIALGGEVYQVDAHSVVAAVVGGNALFWDRLLTDDPAGLEATKNLGVVNTYRIRRAFVTNALIPVGGFMPMLAETIHKKASDGIKPFFGAWTTIDLENSTDVVQNDAKFGIGNDIVLTGAPIAGSYLKYQIVGKTVNVLVFLNRLIVSSLATSEAHAINLNALPFTFKSGIKQSAMYNAEGTHPLGNNGIHFLDLTANKIIFDAQPPSGNDDRTAFNRTYNLQPTPNKNLIAVGDTGATTWTIRATFTAELN